MLRSKFNMKDMGLVEVILGVKIMRTPDSLILTPTHYVEKILEKFANIYTRMSSTPIDTSQHLSKTRGESFS